MKKYIINRITINCNKIYCENIEQFRKEISSAFNKSGVLLNYEEVKDANS